MNVYSVGDEDLSDGELDDFEPGSAVWCVYAYTMDGYEGSGEAVVLRDTGDLDIYYLNHCSCYGPTDNLSTHGHDCITDAQASGSADWWKAFAPLAAAMEVDPR